MSIYTRKGDDGTTSYLGGGRVPKSAARISAYGDVDELNSFIGLAMSTEPGDFEREILESVQTTLFAIGGHLATPDPAKLANLGEKSSIDERLIDELEKEIDRTSAELDPLKAFILPGGSAKAASLHIARTVCRRAERSVVALSQKETVEPVITAYLNRLSDLLFTFARLANHRSRIPDRIW